MRESLSHAILCMFLFVEIIIFVFCIFSVILIAATETLAADSETETCMTLRDTASRKLSDALPFFEQCILDNFYDGVFEVHRNHSGYWQLFPFEDTSPTTFEPTSQHVLQSVASTQTISPMENTETSFPFQKASDYHDVLSVWNSFGTCGAKFIGTDDNWWDYVVGLATPPGFWYDGATAGSAMASWEECGIRDGYLLVEIRWFGTDLSWSEGTNPPTSIPVNTSTQKGMLIRSFSSERRAVELSWCFPDTVTGYITKRKLQVILFVPYRRAEEGGYYFSTTRFSTMIYDEIGPPTCHE